METKLVLLLLSAASAQLTDDFQCPDEFLGYYPHLISCDKYWYCQDSVAELKTCGNGLGFLDTDDTFTLEQCAELHLVECGDRTELEPAISTEHCPRLFGTFPDPEDCGIFWKCQNGKPNRYNCPPGLAYDQVSRGCRWADQVPECATNTIVVDDEGGEFQCPSSGRAGVFTKHAHPADCRQYFLCIGGVPREYGCPLGTVFNIVSGSGLDGKCSDPEEVPECADYYGDLKFDSRALNRAGADTGRQGENEAVRSGADRFRNTANAIQRTSSKSSSSSTREILREESRPAPPQLQAIVDSPSRAAPPRSRPSRPQSPGRTRPQTQFREEPAAPQRVPEPSLPPRLSQIRIQPVPTTTPEPLTTQLRTVRPNRFQVLTDRPLLPQTTFPRRPTAAPTTTEEATTAFPKFSTSSRFNSANRPASTLFNPATTKFVPTQAPAPLAVAPQAPQAPKAPVPLSSNGLPPPVSAAPGPNGEEYYYYYYYYDDEEGAEDAELES